MAILAHVEENGKPLEVALDVVEVAESHTGKVMAQVYNETLREYGIEAKVSHVAQPRDSSTHLLCPQLLAIMGDGASNNRSMAAELVQLIPSFGGEISLIHCFDHVTNIMAQTVTKPFKAGDKKDGGNGDDALDTAMRELATGLGIENLDDLDCEDDDDDDELDIDHWVDESDDLSDAEKEKLKKDLQPIKDMIAKVSCVCAPQFDVPRSNSCPLSFESYP